MKAMHAHFFVEVQRDFAVRSGAQMMAAGFEFTLNGLVLIEFAVGDDVRSIVFAGDRLVAGCEIDDAEARVAQADSAVAADPLALSVRAAMIEASSLRVRAVAGETGSRREYTATIPHILRAPMVFREFELSGTLSGEGGQREKNTWRSSRRAIEFWYSLEEEDLAMQRGLPVSSERDASVGAQCHRRIDARRAERGDVSGKSGDEQQQQRHARRRWQHPRARCRTAVRRSIVLRPCDALTPITMPINARRRVPVRIRPRTWEAKRREPCGSRSPASGESLSTR